MRSSLYVKMARPVRSAAQKARELIAKGFNVHDIDNIGATGMSSGEEDELNEEISLASDPSKCVFEGDEPEDESRRSDGTQRHTAISSYDVEDVVPSGATFRPQRVPGPHLSDRITRAGVQKFTRAIDFFQLFITDELLEMIADNTNFYGWLNVLDKPSYGIKSDGAWEETCVPELKNMIACIIFQGFAGRADIERNWSQATLYSGGWSRRFVSKNRFKALSAMLHITKPGEEDQTDILAKVRPLLEHMRAACALYFHPRRAMSVDEHMVRAKGRSPIRQFMPDKPTRFGYKLWCLCDAETGYTFDFSVYTGKSTGRSKNGLGYDVVSSLARPYFNQGYHIYCDSFFSSVHLAEHLFTNGTYMCGTMQPWHRGFPEILKDMSWSKKAKPGIMRYVRADNAIFVQWLDKRVVNMISTIHKGHQSVMVLRRGKNKDGVYQRSLVRIPSCIHYYNRYMGGVDLVDQMIETYSCIVKCTRWWKILFIHILDVAILNSFLLFKLWRSLHPNVPSLQRCVGYSHLAFREELVRQLAQIDDSEETPLYRPNLRRRKSLLCNGPHDPEYGKYRRNCYVCYALFGKERKTYTRCSDPQCLVHLCLNRKRNCFPKWHSPQFDQHRRRVKKKNASQANVPA